MSYKQLSNEELADLLKEGDREAYTVIFDRFYGLLFRPCLQVIAQ